MRYPIKEGTGQPYGYPDGVKLNKDGSVASDSPIKVNSDGEVIKKKAVKAEDKVEDKAEEKAKK